MKKVLIIIKREYLVRVRTRAFLIGTLVSPLLMLALIALPVFFATRGGGERRVTVLDQSGDPELFEAISRGLASRGEGDEELNRRDPGVGRTRYILSRNVVGPGDDLPAAPSASAPSAPTRSPSWPGWSGSPSSPAARSRSPSPRATAGPASGRG